MNITYNLPLDKLPIADWMRANTAYGADYQWDRCSLPQDTLGNVIQNSTEPEHQRSVPTSVNLYNRGQVLEEF
ncbi:MAG: hypothetical protein IPL77_18050 [Flavobacteriales bacterium]|nr:hypothetical protein [Flavobacteriales bacterium]